jgi:hypothetical protein
MRNNNRPNKHELCHKEAPCRSVPAPGVTGVITRKIRDARPIVIKTSERVAGSPWNRQPRLRRRYRNSRDKPASGIRNESIIQHPRIDLPRKSPYVIHNHAPPSAPDRLVHPVIKRQLGWRLIARRTPLRRIEPHFDKSGGTAKRGRKYGGPRQSTLLGSGLPLPTIVFSFPWTTDASVISCFLRKYNRPRAESATYRGAVARAFLASRDVFSSSWMTRGNPPVIGRFVL